MKKDLIQELREMFDYHPEGFLIRKSTGNPCGHRTNRPDGYVYIRVGKKTLRTHRVIYAIVHGRMPEGEIDHLNGDRADNRIENLRDVSGSENQHNSKVRKDNSSGFPGVSLHTQTRKWHAWIRVNTRLISLGLFDEFEEAVHARKMAKINYHPSSPEAFKYALELFPCGA